MAGCALLACGGDGDGDGTSGGGGPTVGWCLFKGNLSGAVTEALSWDDRQGCGGGNSSAEQKTVGLGWGIINPLNVQLRISGIDEGKTGSGLAAMVRIRQPRDNDKSWKTTDAGCRVDVTTFSFQSQNTVGKSYRIGGSGMCSEPAMPEAGGAAGTITIGPFMFRSTTLY